jgi:hypothetical protein
MSRGGSVGIVTGYKPDGTDFIPGKGKILYSTLSTPGPTQPPIFNV